MILGMSLSTFTAVHVIISLVGIATGLVVIGAMLANRPLGTMNLVFLVTTIATSVTGFFFPFKTFGPPHILGVLSLIVLAAALWALYGAKLSGPARWIYVVSAVVALYFNVFVGVVQSFDKIAALHKLSPTGAGPFFGGAQAIVLLLFIVLGYRAVRAFRPAT